MASVARTVPFTKIAIEAPSKEATTWYQAPAVTAPAGVASSEEVPPCQSRNVTAPLELIRSRY